MRKLLYCDSVGNIGSLALLALRIVVGLAFIFHGQEKVKEANSWMKNMGPELAATAPHLQAAAAYTELVGGAALIAGFLTRIAAIGIGGIMVAAIKMVHNPAEHLFVAEPGKPSFELAATYLACALVFFLIGPGRISLDWLLFRDRKPNPTDMP